MTVQKFSSTNAGRSAGIRTGIFTVLAVNLAVILLLILGEAALHLYTVMLDPKVTIIDSHLGWKHQPNSIKDVKLDGKAFRVTYNDKGLRGTTKTYYNDHSRLRILFLGDSFTDGSTVPGNKTFTHLLEVAEPSLETINMGCYGYGTVQEYLYFTTEGYKYQPDLVVLMTSENDFYDNSNGVYPWIGPRPKAILDDIGEAQIIALQHPATMTLFESSFLRVPYFQYALLKNSLLYYALDQYVYKLIKPVDQNTIHKYQYMQDDSKLIKLYIALAAKLYNSVKSTGSGFAVFLFNSKETIMRVPESPMYAVREELLKRQIFAVDLFSDFKSSLSRGYRVFHQTDPHWNIEGNRLVAELILTHIKSHPSYHFYGSNNQPKYVMAEPSSIKEAANTDA